MTEGPVYQWWGIQYKLVLEIGEYGPGTYYSAPMWPYIEFGENFFFYVWVREVTGDSPGITVFMDYTTDDINTLAEENIIWTEVPGSATTELTGPGNVSNNFQIPDVETYQRARIIITGEDTVMTCRVVVAVTPVLENPLVTTTSGSSPRRS